jgi:hypothetical protein
MSSKMEGIPFKLFKAIKIVFGPGGVNSPVTVTSLFANSKQSSETNVLERLISTPSQSVTKEWYEDATLSFAITISSPSIA